MTDVAKNRGWRALTELLDTQSQSQIAGQCEVSQPTLSVIKGRKRPPSGSTKIKLRKVGIEIEWWDELEENDEPTRESGIPESSHKSRAS